MFTCRYKSFNPLVNANDVASSYVSLCFYGSPQERLVQICPPPSPFSNYADFQNQIPPPRQSTCVLETRIRHKSALALNSVIPGSEASLMNKWSYLYPRSQLGELWWSRWGCREERHRLSVAPHWEKGWVLTGRHILTCTTSEPAQVTLQEWSRCILHVVTSQRNAETHSLVRVVLKD